MFLPTTRRKQKSIPRFYSAFALCLVSAELHFSRWNWLLNKRSRRRRPAGPRQNRLAPGVAGTRVHKAAFPTPPPARPPRALQSSLRGRLCGPANLRGPRGSSGPGGLTWTAAGTRRSGRAGCGRAPRLGGHGRAGAERRRLGGRR